MQHCPQPRVSIAGLGSAVLAACVLAAASTAAAAAESDASRLAKAAVASGDNQGGAFAVVDKKKARVFVFDAAGRPLGDAPVLLGLAHGDDSVPGIGERKMSEIRPDERTTPAGRFASEPGRNLQGEDIVWIDYDAAVSMHRVRANNKAERRLQRLATPGVDDNRISYGCINVPASFYDTHIRPALGQRKGVVYVLPESGPMQARFSFVAQE
ncbi:L,D-transpeptidase [Variovorax boronicumulans]|uniref:L,D-transpeptidase n=1 Tax=Variovorax boronicumulans TaxID=436515 RepID=UPI003D7BFEAA